MDKTRIMLTVGHPLHAQLIKHALATRSDLELAGEATDVIDCMKLISAMHPHVWIHSWDEGPELSAVQSHIYSFHSSLSIIRINPDEPAGYIQLQVNSLPELLNFATQSRHWGRAAQLC
ncbi:helix-turn-helix domain-containing protein [Novipirellula artificiosorum]|uniref:Uncharacterized protein n=1 Tax=Novipirellula artificiosorum TaxID=2528016 RepID=A0A5C6DUX0_9BACT|nr:hypothetical protein [Novipirellula artificiosorum]TWU39737.1 hypothetical protein Poly41_25930 [Novipirellula artificiosorum]